MRYFTQYQLNEQRQRKRETEIETQTETETLSYPNMSPSTSHPMPDIVSFRTRAEDNDKHRIAWVPSTLVYWLYTTQLHHEMDSISTL